MYSTTKMQSIRDADLGLEEITSMTKTIFVNHSERSSVPKRSQASYRKVRNSVREPTIGRESAMATVITCQDYIRPGHKKKDCNRLNKNSDKSRNLENGKRKWCSYHRTNCH